MGPSRDVVELAAAIRVRHGLRAPDALQAASCLHLAPQSMCCSPAMRRVQGLNVTVLA